MSSRIKTQAGNWRNGLPNQLYDVVIVSQVLHEEREDQALTLIKDAADRLVEGGLLLIVGFLDASASYRGVLSSIFTLNLLVELGSDNPKQAWVSHIAKQMSVVPTKIVNITGGRVLWIGRKLPNSETAFD